MSPTTSALESESLLDPRSSPEEGQFTSLESVRCRAVPATATVRASRTPGATPRVLPPTRTANETMAMSSPWGLSTCPGCYSNCYSNAADPVAQRPSTTESAPVDQVRDRAIQRWNALWASTAIRTLVATATMRNHAPISMGSTRSTYCVGGR